MRTLSILFLLSSLLLGKESLSLENALFSDPTEILDFDAAKSPGSIRFFTYGNQLKNSSFVPSSSLESQKILTMEHYDLHTQKHERIRLDYFETTHGVRALSLAGGNTLVAALTDQNHLKVALFDQKGSNPLNYTDRKEQFKHLHKIFTQEDGTFFLLLTVSNADNQLSYFNRGLSSEDFLLLHLNAKMQIIQRKHFGSKSNERLVDGVMTDRGTFKVLAQENDSVLTLYGVSFSEDHIEKKRWTLPEPDRLLSLCADQEGSLIIGGSHSTLYELQEGTIRTIALHDTDHAHIFTLSQDHSNRWYLSGSYANEKGDKDSFIMLTDANFTSIWSRKVHSPFNDTAFFHVFSEDRLHFFGTSYLENGKQKLFYLPVSKNGYPIKLQPPLTLVQRFSQTLQKRIQNRYQKFLDILPTSEILLTNYYDPQSSEISPQVEKELKSFFNDFIDIISSKTFAEHIDKIYFNGFTSSEWHNTTESKRYLNNAKLSQERAFALLETVIESTEKADLKRWLQQHIVLRGYASSQTIQDGDALENFEKSRRSALSIQWK